MRRLRAPNRPWWTLAGLSAWLAILGPNLLLAQSLPGTVIRNQASIAFTGSGGVPETAYSNSVDVVTTIARTRATLSLHRFTDRGGAASEFVGPAQCVLGVSTTPLPPPQTYAGQLIDPSVPQRLLPGSTFHAGEAVFIRLSDTDQNLDAATRDTVVVQVTAYATGDRETIELIESEPDSGTFVGYIPTAVANASINDCTLQVQRSSELRIAYVDTADSADWAEAVGTFDPISRVFDALTGAPVDGASITLVDAVTGQPATVLGDDGIS